MKALYDGCTRGEFSVYPKNWQAKNAPLDVEWRINYRFYDPLFRQDPKYKNGKLIAIRGLNVYSSRAQRQAAVKTLLENEQDLIDVKGYNPISRAFMIEQEKQQDYPIHPDTPFIEALRAAFKYYKGVPGTLQDVRLTIDGIEASAKNLRHDRRSIGDIRRRHIRACLEGCYQVNPNFTDKRFNKYRAWLLALFKILVEFEAVESNYVADISKKKTFVAARTVLTDEQRRKIAEVLPAKHPDFWRYIQIFFHSGARGTELRQLKPGDVNLSSQTYNVLMKKGAQWRQVTKIIKDIAVPLWEEALAMANSNEFLFGKHFRPAKAQMGDDLTSRYWKRLVKNELGIDADFYALKHLHTTEVMDALEGSADALSAIADHNSHTSGAMVVKIYDINSQERRKKTVKALKNKFV